jgi:hypothetical protein
MGQKRINFMSLRATPALQRTHTCPGAARQRGAKGVRCKCLPKPL